MALNKDAILSVKDNTTGTVNVPEWGGEVCVKKPSIRERDALAVFFRAFAKVEKVKVKKGDEEVEENQFIPIGTEESEAAYAKYRLYSVGFALCDENGNRLFSDAEIENVLGTKSPEAIDRIFNELGNVLNLSGSKNTENSDSV